MSNTNLTRNSVAVLEPVDTPIFDELTAHFFTTPVDTSCIFSAPITNYVEAPVVNVQDTEHATDDIVDGPTGSETWLWILALGAVITTVVYLYIIDATGHIA